jgi:hypothetical protein
MKDSVRRFVEVLMINKWIPMKAAIVRERERSDRLREEVKALWEG